ncbi:MAG: hypothetical protein J0L53_12475 [Spirochaetes bacterium]|nr:hypothetical protein [Spirochaetota bacterium]
MAKTLWVDSIRNPPAGSDYDIARNYAQAVAYLQVNTYYAICIDHDLDDFDASGTEKTGYDVLMYLVQLKIASHAVPKHYELLTANPVDRERMEGVIYQYLCVS